MSNESINAEEKQEPLSISSSAVPGASVKVISMADVPLLEVDWLWKPYIPFGKVTIIQGNPGEGKTTLALRLASACSRGKAFHEMEPHEPFNVIYQTAEDGLGDTIKPRLIEAEADLSRVFVIDEADKVLSLLDERIEKAIKEKHARLIILDPLQGYLGTDTDMNRANEIRPIFRRLGEIAQETGCAVVLIEHLNKATGSGSAYRGLGSMDFRAAARSVLLVGRLRKEPNVRVIIHDKSSLAPEGKAIAFNLGNEEGFHWLDGYDGITSEELLGGFGGRSDSKTAQAEELIRSVLADGNAVPCDLIFQRAAELGISQRTVNEAKKQVSGIKTSKSGIKWYWKITNE